MKNPYTKKRRRKKIFKKLVFKLVWKKSDESFQRDTRWTRLRFRHYGNKRWDEISLIDAQWKRNGPRLTSSHHEKCVSEQMRFALSRWWKDTLFQKRHGLTEGGCSSLFDPSLPKVRSAKIHFRKTRDSSFLFRVFCLCPFQKRRGKSGNTVSPFVINNPARFHCSPRERIGFFGGRKCDQRRSSSSPLPPFLSLYRSRDEKFRDSCFHYAGNPVNNRAKYSLLFSFKIW